MPEGDDLCNGVPVNALGIQCAKPHGESAARKFFLEFSVGVDKSRRGQRAVKSDGAMDSVRGLRLALWSRQKERSGRRVARTRSLCENAIMVAGGDATNLSCVGVSDRSAIFALGSGLPAPKAGISCYPCPHGHPHPTIPAELYLRGMRDVYQTDEDDHLIIEPPPQNLWVVFAASARFRPFFQGFWMDLPFRGFGARILGWHRQTA